MNIDDALRSLGAHHDLLTQENKVDLDQRGFTVLEGVIDHQWLIDLQILIEQSEMNYNPSKFNDSKIKKDSYID